MIIATKRPLFVLNLSPRIDVGIAIARATTYSGAVINLDIVSKANAEFSTALTEH